LILDTNALSALAEGDAAVSLECAKAARIALPVIVIGEYRFGIAHSRRKAEYEHWLEQTVAVSTVLDITKETTWHYAEVRSDLKRAGTPIPANDAWIAALSRQHDLAVMSRDRHFDFIPNLRRVGW
jgi:tRNA(fMet)-specific endonuclease VapC